MRTSSLIRRYAPACLLLGSAVACKTEDGSTITPPPECIVLAISVNPGTFSLQPGTTLPLAATVSQTNCTAVAIAWSSSAPGIASVDQAGVVTAVTSGGPVTITATAGGKSASAQITVLATPAAVASLTVTPPNANVLPGGTTSLTAVTRDASGNVLTGRAVAWTSAAPGTASVNASGLVTGVATGGPVTITATSEGQSGTSSITVLPVPVASVVVTPANPTVSVGAFAQLTAITRDAAGNALAGRAITWQSTNVGIATANANGQVTGVAVGGPVRIDARSEGITGSAMVTVTAIPVATVTVAPTPGEVYVGTSVQMAATMRDAAGNVLVGRAVSWQSSNGGIATVSAAGLVTGVAVGGPVTMTGTSEGRIGIATFAVLAPSARLAYARVDNTTVPNASFSFNGTGGGITVTRGSQGSYIVTLGGFGKTAGRKEVPIVTPFANLAVRCQPGIWANSGVNDMDFPVHCVDGSGILVDAAFDILVVGDGSLPARLGFTWPNTPLTPVYAPDAAFTFASSGSAGQVSRAGVGSYVTDLGLARTAADLPETYLASAVDALPSWCNVPSWTVTATVACFRQNGTAVDVGFSLLLLERGRPNMRFAMALADQPSAASYVGNPQYTRSSSGLPVPIVRSSTGSYTVTFYGLAKTTGRTETVQVGAVSGTATYCTIGGWINITAADLEVTVRCFGTGGIPADSKFTIVVIE